MTTFDLSFCPVLQRMIESGETIADDGSTIAAAALSTINNLSILRGLLSTYKARNTLEVGLAHGASALTILGTQTELYHGSFTHTAIDPIQSSNWKRAGVVAIEAAGYAETFVLIEEMSAVALPRLWSEELKYDLIYIDGSHLFEDVFVDTYYACRLAREGAFIVFDDCTDRHVAKVIRFIDRNYDRFLRRHDVYKFKEKNWKSLAARILDRQQAKVYRKVGEPPREWNAVFRNF